MNLHDPFCMAEALRLAECARRWRQYGVEGIASDYPDRIRSIVQKQAEDEFSLDRIK